MTSILQHDKTICFICKQNPCGDPLDKHHVYFSSLRSQSEKYGLTVYLHHNRCHIFGENAVHKNARINRKLQAFAQRKAMKHYEWSIADFRAIFHKNYIEEDE